MMGDTVPSRTSRYEPASALRTALAVVTATIQRNDLQARAAAVDLVPDAARFGLLVLAEYIAQTLHELALERGGTATAEELWQSLCLEAEHAIWHAAAHQASRTSPDT